jgi:adenylosuccinate synthase
MLVHRQLPTGFVRPDTRLLIPAGGLIDLDVLKAEILELDADPKRVGIDYNAMIISDEDRAREVSLSLSERLSSTLCGVGSAVARRALREEGVVLASNATKRAPWLAAYLTNVAGEANQAVDRSRDHRRRFAATEYDSLGCRCY